MTDMITELTITHVLLVEILRAARKEQAGEEKRSDKENDSSHQRDTGEPRWFRDREGDVWEKTEHAWRLHFKNGAVYDWLECPPDEYGPFTPISGDPTTYTLRETAELLQRHGVDTGQHRLKAQLCQLGWVDAHNVPTGAPAGSLVLVSPEREGRHAVVRVTPEGLNRLRDVLSNAHTAG
ncbi:hypothetical protein [Nocardia brasiliensis]|uniref:hypothetical protein n=1 Tax=Nocardia brasiliensis TaxID=37326 RepID=UPI00366D14C9